MNIKEKFYNVITFSICRAQTNKILAIILSSIRFAIYLTTFILLKVWNKETKTLESFCIFQFVYEIIILSTAILMFIFSKYLNRKWIYRFLRIHIVIITIYLFFNFFIDVCIFAGIKYKEFPDLYSLYEDPIFNYTDDKLWSSSYSLEKYIIKDTQKIDIYLINNTFYNYTHLIMRNGKIYVSDPQYFQINFNEEKKGKLKSYQKRHRSEFNIIMVLVLINIILDIVSFLLWNSIKYRHEKLIQNGVIKKYGLKIMYGAYYYGRSCKHDTLQEEIAKRDIQNNENLILYDESIKTQSDSCLTALFHLFAFFAGFITFIVLMALRNTGNFTTKAVHFPFSLTFLGKGLYLYLLIFLFVSFIIDLFVLMGVKHLTNHHSYMLNYRMQCLGGVIVFTIGLVYLFFSICGILGALLFLEGEIDSNGKLYIKTACLDSDITCYGLFQFSSSFPLDNKIYSKIFYYIYIKKISKSDQSKNIASLIIILLIYFCQFYVIVFEYMIDFNFDKEKYGVCLVNDYIIKDNSEHYLIDNINVKIEDNEEYYKNNFNDSYFNISTNNNNNNNDNNTNDINKRKEVKIIVNNNTSKLQTNGTENQTNINSNTLRITSSSENNNK